MWDFIYVFDIAVIIIVLGYRGKQNGMLPESLFCLSTIIAGLAAEANYQTLYASLSGSLSNIDKMTLVALIYALLFIIVRVVLAILGLQAFAQIRSTPFLEPHNRIAGIGFATLKAIFLISIILRCIAIFSTKLPDIAGPVDTNSLVIFFKNIFDYINFTQ